MATLHCAHIGRCACTPLPSPFPVVFEGYVFSPFPHHHRQRRYVAAFVFFVCFFPRLMITPLAVPSSPSTPHFPVPQHTDRSFSNNPDTPHARSSRLFATSNPPPPQCDGSMPAATVSRDFCCIFPLFFQQDPHTDHSFPLLPLRTDSLSQTSPMSAPQPPRHKRHRLPALSLTRLPRSKPHPPHFGSTTRHGGQHNTTWGLQRHVIAAAAMRWHGSISNCDVVLCVVRVTFP